MKKSKILLCGVSVVATFAATTPLVSLSSCSKEENYSEIKFDEEYGVDEFEYKTLVQQFKNLVEVKIEESLYTDEEKQYQKEKLCTEIEGFEESLSEIKSNKIASKSAYTTITNAIIEHAQDEYGIRLNRNSKAQWSDIEQLYTGLKNSWKASLQASGISGDKIYAIMNDVQDNYNKMISDLTERYNDPLSALIKAENELPMVFASVNSEIAYLAAGLALKQFLSNYILEFKDDANDNRLDQLEGSFEYDEELNCDVQFAENNDITAFMNRIFTLRNAKTGDLVPEGFTRHIIPGYRISPILTNIFHDNYENEHSISISWECVKDTYAIGSEDASHATAFLVDANKMDTSTFMNDKDARLSDFIDSNKENRSSMKYDIPVTDDDLKERLTTSFLNPNPVNPYKPIEGDEPEEYHPVQGYLQICWNSTGNIDGFTNDSTEVFPNDAEDGHHYYLVSGYNFAKSHANIKISLDSDTSYDMMDLYDNAEDLVDYNDSQVTKFKLLPPVLKGFGMGCDISAVVDIFTNADGKDVVRFLKGSEPKIYYVDGSNITLDVKVDLNDNIQWKVDKNAWRDIIENYNYTRNFFNDYEFNTFEKDFKGLQKNKAMEAGFFAFSALVDTLTIIGCVGPQTSPGQKLLNTIYLITSAIDLSCAIASFSLFMLYKYNVVRDYANRAKAIRETPEYIEFKQHLDSDRDTFHLLDGEIDDNISAGKTTIFVNEDSFIQNYDKYYSTIEPTKYIELQNRYIHSESDITFTKFKLMLKENNVDMEQYHEELKEWDKGGKWFKRSVALDATCLAIMGFELILALFNSSIRASVDAKHPWKIRQKMAKDGSRHIYCRMWRWFKKLFKPHKLTGMRKAIADETKPRAYHYIKNAATTEGIVGKEGKLAGKKTMQEAAKKLDSFPDSTRTVKAIDEEGKTVEAKERFFGIKPNEKIAGNVTAYKGTFENAEEFVYELKRLPLTTRKGAKKEHVIAAAIKDELVDQAKNGLEITFHRTRQIVVQDKWSYNYKWIQVQFTNKRAMVETFMATTDTIEAIKSSDEMIFFFTKVIEKIEQKAATTGKAVFDFLKGRGRSDKEAFITGLKKAMTIEERANSIAEGIVKRLKSLVTALKDGTEAVGESSTLFKFIKYSK